MELNITIIKRDDVDLDVVFRDKDDNLIDLTGCTVFFTVKKKTTDVDLDAIIAKDVTDHTSPTLGETRIPLTKEETNVKVGNYFFDLQIKNASGKILSTEVGICKVTQDVTVRAT